MFLGLSSGSGGSAINGAALFEDKLLRLCLLCTVMTHTSRSVSKANTCFTGGVVFLEAQDNVSLRDLETGRKAVVRPSHTFFGLVQLSGLDT